MDWIRSEFMDLPSKHNGTSALDIVIECPVGISVSVQVVEGLFTVEILKLDYHVGVHFFDGLHELVHEVLLILIRNSLLAQTQVERVLQIRLVVGAAVQNDGQGLGRVNACSRRVQSQFTNLQYCLN
jgi:hypothetical protein